MARASLRGVGKTPGGWVWGSDAAVLCCAVLCRWRLCCWNPVDGDVPAGERSGAGGLVAEGSRVEFAWCECESVGRRRVLQDTRLVRVRQAWLAVAALSREGTDGDEEPRRMKGEKTTQQSKRNCEAVVQEHARVFFFLFFFFLLSGGSKGERRRVRP